MSEYKFPSRLPGKTNDNLGLSDKWKMLLLFKVTVQFMTYEFWYIIVIKMIQRNNWYV